MPFFTHPQSRISGAIFELAASRLGVVKASAWLFIGNADLDGESPLQAIKQGREDDVKRLLLDLEAR